MQAAAFVTSPVGHGTSFSSMFFQALRAIAHSWTNPLLIGEGNLLTLPGAANGTVVTGSLNVSWNGLAAARVGNWTSLPDTLALGSTTVFVNGMPACRVGDPTSTGEFILAGSPTVFIGGGQTALGSGPTFCAMLANARDKAVLADRAEGSSRPMPPGYRQLDPNTPAGQAELATLGVKPTDLTPTDSQFRAQIYAHDTANGTQYTVAYKGTTPSSGSDWYNNAQQSLGFHSDYYNRGIGLANTMNASTDGNVDFTGHSLGGGMASAAGAVTGRPTNTFNAAGLNANTVNGFPPNGANVDAWHNPGDPLTGVQSATPLPGGYGTPHALPFVPPPNSSWMDRHMSPISWHGMDYILRGIDAQSQQAGCGG